MYQDLNSHHSFVPREVILSHSSYLVCVIPSSSLGNYDVTVICKYRLAEDLHSIGNKESFKGKKGKRSRKNKNFTLFFYNFCIRKRDLPTNCTNKTAVSLSGIT